MQPVELIVRYEAHDSICLRIGQWFHCASDVSHKACRVTNRMALLDQYQVSAKTLSTDVNVASKMENRIAASYSLHTVVCNVMAY